MDDFPCLCTSLRDAAFATTDSYDRALAPSGLKVTMFRLLRRLSKMDKPTISELAHVLKLDRSTLGRNLKVLERGKLIGFNSGKDERSKHVVLTPEGKSVLIIATPFWQAAQQKFLLSLGDDAGLLVEILAKIDRDAGDEKRKKSGHLINGDYQ